MMGLSPAAARRLLVLTVVLAVLAVAVWLVGVPYVQRARYGPYLIQAKAALARLEALNQIALGVVGNDPAGVVESQPAPSAARKTTAAYLKSFDGVNKDVRAFLDAYGGFRENAYPSYRLITSVMDGYQQVKVELGASGDVRTELALLKRLRDRLAAIHGVLARADEWGSNPDTYLVPLAGRTL